MTSNPTTQPLTQLKDTKTIAIPLAPRHGFSVAQAGASPTTEDHSLTNAQGRTPRAAPSSKSKAKKAKPPKPTLDVLLAMCSGSTATGREPLEHGGGWCWNFSFLDSECMFNPDLEVELLRQKARFWKALGARVFWRRTHHAALEAA